MVLTLPCRRTADRITRAKKRFSWKESWSGTQMNARPRCIHSCVGAAQMENALRAALHYRHRAAVIRQPWLTAVVFHSHVCCWGEHAEWRCGEKQMILKRYIGPRQFPDQKSNNKLKRVGENACINTLFLRQILAPRAIWNNLFTQYSIQRIKMLYFPTASPALAFVQTH